MNANDLYRGLKVAVVAKGKKIGTEARPAKGVIKHVGDKDGHLVEVTVLSITKEYASGVTVESIDERTYEERIHGRSLIRRWTSEDDARDAAWREEREFAYAKNRIQREQNQLRTASWNETAMKIQEMLRALGVEGVQYNYSGITVPKNQFDSFFKFVSDAFVRHSYDF